MVKVVMFLLNLSAVFSIVFFFTVTGFANQGTFSSCIEALDSSENISSHSKHTLQVWEAVRPIIQENLDQARNILSSERGLSSAWYKSPFFEDFREMNVFDSSPEEFFFKIERLQILLLSRYNKAHPNAQIQIDQLIKPGFIMQNDNKEVLYLRWGQHVPDDYNLLAPDYENVYSSKYLYPSLSANIFPISVTKLFVTYHDLVGHTLGLSLNPLYNKVYLELSSWVTQLRYSRLSKKQKDMLHFFNEKFFIISKEILVSNIDTFSIIESSTEPAYLQFGYTPIQIAKHIYRQRLSAKDLILLANKVVEIGFRFLKPAGGVSSEIYLDYQQPPPLAELEKLLKEVTEKKTDPTAPERDRITHLVSRSQSVMLQLLEFEVSKFANLIHGVSSELEYRDFLLLEKANDQY